jgi:enterochelin esterase family protein
MRVLITAALCWLSAGAAFCQRGPAPFYEDTNNIPVSPEVHSDRTVTFRLFAPKASEVLLMGSPGILEFTKKPLPLEKGR